MKKGHQNPLNLVVPIEKIEHNRIQIRKNATFGPYTDRRPKRFLTSRHDEDKHENFSACPSIEKELPELSIHVTNKINAQETNSLIDYLIKQNQLKEEAMSKATAMITLLREENSELNERIEEFEIVLREKERTIEMLEDKQMSNSQNKILTRDIETERSRQRRDSKTQIYTPREGAEVKSKNELFFEFAQSKDRNGVHRSQDKIINSDHPTFKEISSQIGISKKLTPFASRVTTKNQVVQQNNLGAEAISKLAALTLNEEIEKNRVMVEQLQEMTQLQQEGVMELMQNLRQRQEEEQFSEPEQRQERFQTLGGSDNISKNLFGSTEKKHNQNNKDNRSVEAIIRSYEDIIERYRIYSAYLKSYLCQAINSLTSYPQKASIEVNLVPYLKHLSKEISDRQKGKIFSLAKENKELKSIIEGLIRNIEKMRKAEPTVHAWSDYPLENSR